MFEKTVLVVSGMSGSGKSTLVNRFLEENNNFSRIPNYATREKRGEKEEDYIFISKDDFLEKRKNGVIIDTTKTFNKKDWYGLGELPSDKSISILTPTGVNFLKYYCEKFNYNFLSILLNADQDIIIDRLKTRGESEEFIFPRIKKDIELFEGKEKLYNIIIDGNKGLDEVFIDFKDKISNYLNIN